MICRIRETSLDKPNRGKSNSGFSTRIFHKVVQHIRLFRLLQHAQKCLVCLATINQYYVLKPRRTTVRIRQPNMALDHASTHSQFLQCYYCPS